MNSVLNFIVCFLSLAKINPLNGIDLWKDKWDEAYDYDFPTSEDSTKFKKNLGHHSKEKDDLFSIDNLFRRKQRNSILSIYGENAGNLLPIPHSFHSTSPLNCGCEIEYRLVDLGNQYFPRYIHSGTCKDEYCGNFRKCKEKHYKIRILKKKGQNEEDNTNGVIMPDNLKDSWNLESVPVTVACECVPKL